MRALILGRTGQVAQSLLAHRGDIDALTLGRPDVDLTDTQLLLRAMRKALPDVVINAAAYTAVDAAETDEAACYAVNSDGATNAASVAAELGLPFIHLSTDFVFDGRKQAPYLEDDTPAPLGVYGASKLAGENGVRSAHPEAVIIRLSWVYAAQGRNFARTMLRLAAERDELSVVDDQRGRPTSADDVATALWTVARGLVAKPPPRQLYHLGPQGTASWADFAERIMLASSQAGGPHAVIRRITTQDYPTPAKRPANSVLDCTRIAEDWGIVLPHWTDSCDHLVQQMVRQDAALTA